MYDFIKGALEILFDSIGKNLVTYADFSVLFFKSLRDLPSLCTARGTGKELLLTRPYLMAKLNIMRTNFLHGADALLFIQTSLPQRIGKDRIRWRSSLPPLCIVFAPIFVGFSRLLRTVLSRFGVVFSGAI